jgi:PAS domain S-box-containing protein
MNNFQINMPDTAERNLAERHIEGVRQQGGVFVEAVRATRMPMLVTDATLPGNPITFVNKAFINLSGYTYEELLGQDPHFMNGEKTDPEAIRQYQAGIAEGRDVTLEIVQYRKDGTPFQAMLFATPLNDGQGTVTNHFMSYLDITRRYDAEEKLQALAAELEARVAARTRDLEAANQKLASLVADRERLMVEVNHRAKNSLAIAASLLGIQGRRQSDRAVRVLFEEAHDRLNSMARVHDLLSKSESSQRVEVATYVKDLCEALRPITENDDRIRLVSQVEEGILIEADVAVPLGIVLTELITNAVKYAFPAPNSGTILVHLCSGPVGTASLLVRDDGIGMSNVREGSLGYGLVRSLVQQIGGRIETRSESGLTATVSFPASRQTIASDPHVGTS